MTGRNRKKLEQILWFVEAALDNSLRDDSEDVYNSLTDLRNLLRDKGVDAKIPEEYQLLSKSRTKTSRREK